MHTPGQPCAPGAAGTKSGRVLGSRPNNSTLTDVRYVPINAQRPMGHVSGAGISAPENDLRNAEVAKFLDLVPDRGRRIQ